MKIQPVKFNFVFDSTYGDIIQSLVSQSKRWVLASIFLVDTTSSRGQAPLVSYLAQQLSEAVKRGVFVRIIIGGSSNTNILLDHAFGAAALLRGLGVPCQIASSVGNPSHKKMVVIDDYVLIGSHNWSEYAWTVDRQESVLMKGSGVSAFFSEIIRTEWETLTSQE